MEASVRHQGPVGTGSAGYAVPAHRAAPIINILRYPHMVRTRPQPPRQQQSGHSPGTYPQWPSAVKMDCTSMSTTCIFAAMYLRTNSSRATQARAVRHAASSRNRRSPAGTLPFPPDLRLPAIFRRPHPLPHSAQPHSQPLRPRALPPRKTAYVHPDR